MNALFWPVNMVDYEEDLIGGNWSHYDLPGQDLARIMNHADEGYTSGADMSGPAEVDHEKPRLGLTYKLDAKNEEIPDEVEDEKPETDFEDPDDEITHPEWYYPED